MAKRRRSLVLDPTIDKKEWRKVFGVEKDTLARAELIVAAIDARWGRRSERDRAVWIVTAALKALD